MKGDVRPCPKCGHLYDKKSYCRPCAGELHWWQKGKGMDIREAITKAGPGGKIRRECWVPEVPSYIVPKDDVESPKQERTWEHGQEITSIMHLTATDWQVIPEERIEVGDTVMVSGRGKSEFHVLSVDLPYAHLKDLDFLVRIEDLTLIRKGGKPDWHEIRDVAVYGGQFDSCANGFQETVAMLKDGMYNVIFQQKEAE